MAFTRDMQSPRGRDLLAIDDLTVHFPVSSGLIHRKRYTVRAVEHLSLAVSPGETLALVGESGSGKSTIARAVFGLVEPTAGRIAYLGRPLDSRRRDMEFRRQVQMIFQDPFASLDPRQTVGRSIGEGLAIHAIGRPAQRRDEIRRLLDRVGLSSVYASRYPHQLSGGQRQRVGIARAISLRPKVIVADEPVSALDVSIRAQILNLMADLQDELEMAYVVISHDLGVVRHTSDRVAILYLGRLMEIGPTSQVFQRSQHPYTMALMSADPVPDPVKERERQRIILTGQIPSPISPPVGCRFSTRCWLRPQLGNPSECVESEPVLAGLDGHQAACHFSSVLPAAVQ